MKAGDIFPAGPYITTALATIDFETRSDAGYRWDESLQKWKSLPGMAENNRGLGAVGLRNYIAHESFAVLSLAYDLLDGSGNHLWTPQMAIMPRALLDHIRAGGLIE